MKHYEEMNYGEKLQFLDSIIEEYTQLIDDLEKKIALFDGMIERQVTEIREEDRIIDERLQNNITTGV